VNEITDRYDVLGIARPDPQTVCKGHCEGTGVVPVQAADDDPQLAQRWEAAEAKDPAADGWHFVTCPTCDGTGKQPASDPKETA
jgi:hypothetical protein